METNEFVFKPGHAAVFLAPPLMSCFVMICHVVIFLVISYNLSHVLFHLLGDYNNLGLNSWLHISIEGG